MAGLTFRERMKRKRAAMTPAERRASDAGQKYTAEANTALRKGQRALQGMTPGTNKRLRGTIVNGKAVEVHKSATGMDVIRMANSSGNQSRLYESHHGNWRASNDYAHEQKVFGSSLGTVKRGKQVQASSGHSGG